MGYAQVEFAQIKEEIDTFISRQLPYTTPNHIEADLKKCEDLIEAVEDIDCDSEEDSSGLRQRCNRSIDSLRARQDRLLDLLNRYKG